MLGVKINRDDSLGAFIHKLNREDMPLFSQTVKNILDVSNKEDSPLSDLSLVVLKDPSLTAKVLMIANCALYSREARKTTTISRAVLQLGYKVVRSICITSLLIEKLATGPRKEMVVAEMVKSFHAAIQARSLAISRGDPSGEEIFIATLLYRIGHIAFWSSGGAGAELLSEALQERPEDPPKQVEKDILGFSLQELSYGLAKEWGLGDLLEASLSIPNQNRRSVNVLLGHALADGIASGWKSTKLERAISNTAKFLHRSEEEVTKMVKDNVEITIKTAQDYGLGAVNQLLPPESEPVQDSKTEAPSADQELNAMVQLEILSELNSLIKDPQFNLNLFMISLIEGISRGIGLTRVILTILSPDKKTVNARFGVGWDQAAIECFRVGLKPSFPNVFSEVIENKAPMWVNGTRGSMASYVTEEVKTHMGTQHFFIAPILVKGAVIGVICADCGKSHGLLTTRKFSCFEFMVNTSNDVLSAVL
jgi:HD-like signal output (HDOD) protein